MSVFEIRDRLFARFPLASAPEVTKVQRIRCAEAQLRAAAAAGDATGVARVMRRLRELGIDPRLREHVLVLLARLPLGRYYGGPMAKAVMRFSRCLFSFLGSVHERLGVRPGDRAS
jgi:hypothetical protein